MSFDHTYPFFTLNFSQSHPHLSCASTSCLLSFFFLSNSWSQIFTVCVIRVWSVVDLPGAISLKRTDSPFSSRYWLPTGPQLGLRPTPLAPCWILSDLGLWGSCACFTIPVSSHMQMTCCVWKILFHCGHLPLLPPTIFLPPLPWWSSSLGKSCVM